MHEAKRVQTEKLLRKSTDGTVQFTPYDDNFLKMRRSLPFGDACTGY